MHEKGLMRTGERKWNRVYRTIILLRLSHEKAFTQFTSFVMLKEKKKKTTRRKNNMKNVKIMGIFIRKMMSAL